MVEEFGESGPVHLAYDVPEDLSVGAGVYYNPAVTMKRKEHLISQVAKEAMQSFELFVAQAHEYSELFGGPSKLNRPALKSIWDATQDEPQDVRVDKAITMFLLKGIPEQPGEKDPYFNDFQKSADQNSKWKNAQGVFFAQRMKGITGKHLTFSVEPPLPAGLFLNGKTGVISGKPTVTAEKQAYSVTVTSKGGTCTAAIEFKVSGPSAPKNLKYPEIDGGSFQTGMAISLAPTVEGTVSKWAVREALPSGLTLDAATGMLCGVPTEAMPERKFNIMAKNDTGTVTVQLTFRVVHEAPSDLKYHEDEATPSIGVIRGMASTAPVQLFAANRFMRLYPSVDGENVTYSIDADMPEGLTFSETSGVISGTPTEVCENKRYVVTAENETGSTKCSLTLAVRVAATESIAYEEIDDLYAVGEEVHLKPQVVGSATHWSVEPPLPGGLQLDPSTGFISGTCSETAEEHSYTVTGASEQGGTSCVVTFAVSAPAPEGLSYPAVADDYVIGQTVTLEPSLEAGWATSYAVTPELPPGLELHKVSGIISGTLTTATPLTEYTVEASSTGGDANVVLKFLCHAPVLKPMMSKDNLSVEAEDMYSSEIENVENLEGMPEEPNKAMHPKHWMLWMVHRAQLDDPSLTTFSFSQLSMPLPKDEPRIAPKLVRAIASNKHITSLDLSNSNLRAQEGLDLAASLRCNTILQTLNVDNNHLDADAIQEILSALTNSKGSAITAFYCSHMVGMAQTFGKGVEQAAVNLATKNPRIKWLNILMKDTVLAGKMTTAIRKNNDQVRRRRKGSTMMVVGHVAVEKPLVQLILTKPNEGSVSDFYPDDTDNTMIIRRFIAEKGKAPTKEQLQVFAKKQERPLKYSEVAPLLRNFRRTLLETQVGIIMSGVTDNQTQFQGLLTQWAEKNECWTVSIMSQENNCTYQLTSRKDIIIDASEEVRQWLWSGDILT